MANPKERGKLINDRDVTLATEACYSTTEACCISPRNTDNIALLRIAYLPPQLRHLQVRHHLHRHR